MQSPMNAAASEQMLQVNQTDVLKGLVPVAQADEVGGGEQRLGLDDIGQLRELTIAVS